MKLYLASSRSSVTSSLMVREKVMPSADRLDHTVINVKIDMDAASALFGELGFTLTPRGYHSHGSMNHLMMFGTDYLELIGIPEDT